MTELPLLDETRCTGCADCVAVCPTDCLAMTAALHGPALPTLARPVDCVSCSLCVLICPADALHMAEPAPA
jgi:NAD-dependent dihydropyrimidine dehydrogenase PreA subunit